jgi:hypothetical protein
MNWNDCSGPFEGGTDSGPRPNGARISQRSDDGFGSRAAFRTTLVSGTSEVPQLILLSYKFHL